MSTHSKLQLHRTALSNSKPWTPNVTSYRFNSWHAAHTAANLPATIHYTGNVPYILFPSCISLLDKFLFNKVWRVETFVNIVHLNVVYMFNSFSILFILFTLRLLCVPQFTVILKFVNGLLNSVMVVLYTFLLFLFSQEGGRKSLPSPEERKWISRQNHSVGFK